MPLYVLRQFLKTNDIAVHLPYISFEMAHKSRPIKSKKKDALPDPSDKKLLNKHSGTAPHLKDCESKLLLSSKGRKASEANPNHYKKRPTRRIFSKWISTAWNGRASCPSSLQAPSFTSSSPLCGRLLRKTTHSSAPRKNNSHRHLTISLTDPGKVITAPHDERPKRK